MSRIVDIMAVIGLLKRMNKLLEHGLFAAWTLGGQLPEYGASLCILHQYPSLNFPVKVSGFG